MTAAELLRDLASVNELCAEEREALHALLPLLAGLVEAVGRLEELSDTIRNQSDPNLSVDAIFDARDGVSAAYAALNAATAKEV